MNVMKLAGLAAFSTLVSGLPSAFHFRCGRTRCPSDGD